MVPAIASFIVRVSFALVRKPHLIPTAFRQAASLAPRRWWASGSRLPVPSADYMAFRQVTLSGDAEEVPSVEDAIVFLEWCRSMRALPGRA